VKRKLRLLLRLRLGGGQWWEFGGDVPEAGGEYALPPETAVVVLDAIRQGRAYDFVLLAHWVVLDGEV
jgi:hypothetical protein